MDQRLQLHNLLLSILETKNVYFQPPASKTLDYPCIIYSLSDIDEKFANNKLYLRKRQYLITVIDANPDSVIPDKIGELPLTSFNRHYTSDNLNHDVFTTYY